MAGLSTVSKSHVLEKQEKKSDKSEMHLSFQLIDLLFTKASAEMVSVEGRLSRKGNQEKSRVVPNYTRT